MDPFTRPLSRRALLPLLAPNRICVIKPSAFGDVVQALPLAEALKSRFPEASVAWVIREELADLVSGHPCLDEILCFSRRNGLRAQWRFLGELRSRRFDLVLDLQGLFRTALMTAATRAPCRVGLETAREGASMACTHTIPGTGRDVPAHARYWRAAAALGVSSARPPVRLHVPAEADRQAESLLAPLRIGGGPVLAVHPGAKWETKRWPVQKFSEVLARIPRVAVVVIGGLSEQLAASQILSEVQSQGGRGIDLAGRTSLKLLAALLSRVDALLSNDSGPLHLAAELGTPVVGVYTCTSAVLSGPPSGRHELCQASLPCAGGYHKACPKSGADRLACFDSIDVDRVARALRQLLPAASRTARAA